MRSTYSVFLTLFLSTLVCCKDDDYYGDVDAQDDGDYDDSSGSSDESGKKFRGFGSPGGPGGTNGSGSPGGSGGTGGSGGSSGIEPSDNTTMGNVPPELMRQTLEKINKLIKDFPAYAQDALAWKLVVEKLNPKSKNARSGSAKFSRKARQNKGKQHSRMKKKHFRTGRHDRRFLPWDDSIISSEEYEDFYNIA